MEATKNPQAIWARRNRSAFLDTIKMRKRLGSVSVSCYLFLFERLRSSSPVMWLWIGQISSAGLSALEDRNDARGRRIENPKGISSLSPGLRGTSYPG